MKRTCVLALVSVSAAVAQGFSQLATNRDGSVLYFSSPLRMKGTDQYLHPKIFRWDKSNGVQLYDQRPLNLGFPIPVIGLGTDFFLLQVPDVSSDASTVAVTAVQVCNYATSCRTSINTYQTTIYAAGKPALNAPGTGSLSRNGRYALFRSSGVDELGIAALLLMDLQTGQQISYGPVPQQVLGRRQQVADDGTLVFFCVRCGGLSLAQNGNVRSISTNTRPASFVPPLINNDATLVFYQSDGPSAVPGRLITHLVAYSVTSGLSIDLATGTPGIMGADTTGFGASISDDGTRVAFLNGETPQVYVIRSDGPGLRQITDIQEAVTEAVITGDGSAVFTVTASNRIVRTDVATGKSTEIIPATPYTLRNLNLLNSLLWTVQVSRGEVTTIGGSGFAAGAESAAAPFPLTLGGVELRVGGAPVPIAAAASDSVGFPVPWDFPDAPVEVEIWSSSAGASAFVPGFRAVPAPPAYLAAAHQDFSALISSQSPPQPGEVIHVYGRNLGPVDPAPPSGLPAPLSPLSQLTTPVSCELVLQGGGRHDPVDFLFAGLAPQLLNVFQIDVRMPDSYAAGPAFMSCHIGDPSKGYNLDGPLW